MARLAAASAGVGAGIGLAVLCCCAASLGGALNSLRRAPRLTDLATPRELAATQNSRVAPRPGCLIATNTERMGIPSPTTDALERQRAVTPSQAGDQRS